MSDFEENLNTILSDPNAMGEILSLANRLGLSGSTATDGEGESAPEDTGIDAPPPPSSTEAEQMGNLGSLLGLLRAGQKNNPQAEALIAALRPYLREGSRRKLDKACRLAGLSQTARAAYRLWKEGELHL